MKAIKVNSRDKTKRELIASEVVEAKNFFEKLFGLIIKKKLKDNQGFLIKNCNSIHTFWMRYSIDAVFLNEENLVLSIFHKIKPFRVTPFIKNACCVLELLPGTAEKILLREGDLVIFQIQ